MPLNDRQVRAAKPEARRYELVDGDGLSLVVMPSGAKIWRLRYRVKATGERKRYVLGRYPDLSLSDARGEAAGHRGDIHRGGDPAGELTAGREAMRMIDLFGETDPDDASQDTAPGWYLGAYVRTAGKLGTSKSETTIASDRYRIAKHLRKRRALMRKRVTPSRSPTWSG